VAVGQLALGTEVSDFRPRLSAIEFNPAEPNLRNYYIQIEAWLSVDRRRIIIGRRRLIVVARWRGIVVAPAAVVVDSAAIPAAIPIPVVMLLAMVAPFAIVPIVVRRCRLNGTAEAITTMAKEAFLWARPNSNCLSLSETLCGWRAERNRVMPAPDG
jgi:hypothetical protein